MDWYTLGFTAGRGIVGGMWNDYGQAGSRTLCETTSFAEYKAKEKVQ